MTSVYFIIYNFLFIPVFFLIIHIVAIFHPKVRNGITGRYFIYSKLREAKERLAGQAVMVIHCASMGEFEHIKPFLLKFKKIKPDFHIVVLFFSPSGGENVKSFQGVDLFLYAPFDWMFPIWRFMRRLKPKLWIIAKHDVWPNQVWISRYLNIPVFLVNASLHQQSRRLFWFTRLFHRSIYKHFNRVLTISENDQQNFLQLVKAEKIVIAGDTKYDQVFFRKEESQKKQIIDKEKFKNRWVFVAGSTWPEDHKQLLPAINNLHRKNANFLSILCPHEPTSPHINEIIQGLQLKNYILLSDIDRYNGEAIVIVDRIGVLANIYGLAKIAYVGGSFKQNVHNVLEPAVYGIPVLFGPVNLNSHEAQLLKTNGGAIEVHKSFDIENYLNRFLMNEIYRKETGLKALGVVEQNKGATERTIQEILSVL